MNTFPLPTAAAGQMLSPAQAGEIVGLHPEVIRREVRCGHLRAHTICRRIRIWPHDLHAWVDKHANELAQA